MIEAEGHGPQPPGPAPAGARGSWAERLRQSYRPEHISGDWDFARRVVIAIALAALAYLLWSVARVLLLVFAAALLGLLLQALAERIARYTPVPKRWSLTVAVVAVGLLLLGFLALFGAQIAGQVRTLAEQLPSALDQLGQRFGIPDATNMAEQAIRGGASGNVLSGIAGVGFTILGALGDLIIVIVASIFLAADPHLYAGGAVKLVPEAHHARIRSAFAATGLALRRWFAGQLIAMIAVGTLSGLAYWFIGLPSPLGLGVIAGFFNFIPFIGPIIGALPAVVFAAAEGGQAILWTIAAALAIQQLEGNVLMPIIQRRAVSLPPALALFAILVFGLLFGFLGVFLAVPLTVALMVLVKKLWIRDTLGEETSLPGEDDGHEPRDRAERR